MSLSKPVCLISYKNNFCQGSYLNAVLTVTCLGEGQRNTLLYPDTFLATGQLYPSLGNQLLFFFLECQDQVSLKALAFNVPHSNLLKSCGAKVGQEGVEGILVWMSTKVVPGVPS